MEDQGYLTTAQASATAARNNPAQLSEAAAARAGGYFADWVMASGPEFFTRNTTEDVVIKTTLDQRIQTGGRSGAEVQVFDEKVSEGSKAQAAIVVMSADGAVRAMVGADARPSVSGRVQPRDAGAAPDRDPRSNPSSMPPRWNLDIRRWIR